MTVTLTVLRFGVNAFDSEFMSNTSGHLHNSAEFVAFYGLVNLYLFTMAFVYSPSKNAVYGALDELDFIANDKDSMQCNMFGRNMKL